MQVMIELDVSRVAAPGSQHIEFRMFALKASDIFYESSGAPACREICMAPSAIVIAGVGQTDRSAMIGVAGSACGRESLRDVMHGAVMAREALLIDDFGVIKTQVGDVASGTLLRQNGVRARQASRGVHAAVAARGIPRDAQDRDRGGCDREQESPAAQRARSFEVFEINSLREFFGCACSWQESRSSAYLNRPRPCGGRSSTGTLPVRFCEPHVRCPIRQRLRKPHRQSACATRSAARSPHGRRQAKSTQAKVECAAAASRAAKRASGFAA